MRNRPARNEKPLHWVGSSKQDLLEFPEEVVDNIGYALGSTAVVRLRRAIYVLHCFQKKSPSGIRTARPDIERVDERLKAAKRDYEARYGKETH